MEENHESNKNDSEEVTESFSIEDTCKDDEDSGKYSLPIEMYGKMDRLQLTGQIF